VREEGDVGGRRGGGGESGWGEDESGGVLGRGAPWGFFLIETYFFGRTIPAKGGRSFLSKRGRLAVGVSLEVPIRLEGSGRGLIRGAIK